MVLPKIDFKIGTKLAIMSGLSIAMVTGMVASTVFADSAVKRLVIEAAQEQAVALELNGVGTAIRYAQSALRDLQKPETLADVKKAVESLEARSKKTISLLDTVIPKVKIGENRERAQKLKDLFVDYVKAGNELAVVQNELLSSGISGSRKDTLSAQAKALADRASGGSKMVDMSDQASEFAKADADKLVEDAISQMERAEYINLVVGAIVILLLIGSGIFGIASIARPLSRLVPELKKLAAGDFNVAIPGTGRKDEVGEIAEAAEMVADRVGATIVNIKMSASEVTNASAEISASTTDLSQRTEEQAASLEETSASMEEMTVTVKKNAENARQASDLATSTREVADRGGEVVAKTVEAMAKIEESSRKISDIIIVIDEIARQTNLLALNAAVEAARAGDAGRGFAVVASEVRSLAQRSSQAAKDIKDLITNSTGQVKDGVELVNRAGQSLHEIVESIKKVTTVVTEIANASMEQSTGLEQINRALTQMDEVTQQNSALVEENAATAKTLEQQAKSMDERVAVFKVRADAQQAAQAQVAASVAMPRQQSASPQRLATQQPKRANGAARTNGAAHGGPVGRMQAGLAVAFKEDVDWKEF